MQAGAYLGIDLGGTDIKTVALSPDRQTLWERRLETRAAEGRNAVVDRMVGIVQEASRDLGSTTIRSVGVAIPGVLDMESGRVELLTNMTPEWNGFNLRDAMEERTGLPITLLNDVRAATLAEHHVGAGRGYTHFICVAIGTGIGGGIVIDNKLYLGSRGAAGEIGHATVQPHEGYPCNCGSRGCLETEASALALARQARAEIAAGDSELAELAGSAAPSPHQLAIAAERGSATARAIYRHAGTMTGIAMAGLICALNPQAIVVGGGVAEAGELLLGPIREEIERRTIVFSRQRGGVDLLHSPLGGRAGAIGAASWAMGDTARDRLVV